MNAHPGESVVHLTPTSTYLLVYAALMLLLATTVGVYFIDLGPANVAAALAIAGLKAALVVIFFMHLKQSSGVTRVFAAAGLAWLGILIALTLNDYLTRGW